MRVASFCKLPLGVVGWHAEEPMLTVVVKATYSLAQDGEAQLAEAQDALYADMPDPRSDAGGVRYASDFTPQKARCDVLVVGHARAATPSNVIRARFVYEGVDRSFLARSVEPATKIPLVARHLRASESADAAAVVVGPRSPWSPERSAFASPEIVGARGEPLVSLGGRFDYQFFNVAPREQQPASLGAPSMLVLEGLLEGAPLRQAWLPDHRPRVFALGKSGATSGVRGGEIGIERVVEVAVARDTLWIDADRALCTVTWRGALALGMAAEPSGLVLALDDRSVTSWRDLRDALGAVPWVEVDVVGTSRPPGVSGRAPPPSSIAMTTTDDDGEIEEHETLRRASVPDLRVQADDDWGEKTHRHLSSADLEDDDDDPATAQRAPARRGDGVVEVDTYAMVLVGLTSRPLELEAILAQHGLTLLEWRATERHYAGALAAEARAGGDTLTSALDAALERARALT